MNKMCFFFKEFTLEIQTNKKSNLFSTSNESFEINCVPCYFSLIISKVCEFHRKLKRRTNYAECLNGTANEQMLNK